MARLNPRSSSATAGRSALSPSDSRHNTPSLTRNQYSPSLGSDKENPRKMPDKGKGRLVEIRPSPARKRRRIGDDESIATSSSEDEDNEADAPLTPQDGDDDLVEDVTDTVGRQHASARGGRPSAATQKSVRFYDQAQDEGERRELKRKSRRLEREFTEHRDEYLKSGNDGLVKTVKEADTIFESVKQTADATTDSRLMVSVSDIAHRKSAQLVLGDTATGIDVDEFVSKCISFMRRNGGTMSSTQRRQQQRDDDEDDDDEDVEVLDWAHLGAQACFPYNARPGVPSFLLGPLSVQKRQRQATQRRARQRQDDRAEVAPEALEKEDLATGETNTVRYACAQIKKRLIEHCETATEVVESQHLDSMTDDETSQLLRANRITESGGPNLFDFALNPHSFGQTVENLFYISFLIKEGEVGIDINGGDGLPSLVINEESVNAARARKSTRHQAVFGIDYTTWRDLVTAFEITEPLIPHRREDEAAHVGAKGWYT